MSCNVHMRGLGFNTKLILRRAVVVVCASLSVDGGPALTQICVDKIYHVRGYPYVSDSTAILVFPQRRGLDLDHRIEPRAIPVPQLDVLSQPAEFRHFGSRQLHIESPEILIEILYGMSSAG